MAPYDLLAVGRAFEFAVFLLIGMAFGGVLEMSGFGDSRKLAAQFYLRDLTVLKVMFTAIVVAAVLIHLAAALQLLDLPRVWINPTYLWPGIVGGLVMGVGFIVGGFCPGTSLVAAATLKLDGVFFVLGGLTGVFLFGETVRWYDAWWRSSYLGRFTLADWLGLPTGTAVVALVAMAFGMFALGEWAERRFGESKTIAAPRPARWAAVALLGVAALAAVIGQPSADDRWRAIAPRAGRDLESRAVLVDPAEVVALRSDLTLAVRVLEVRAEADFNLFHLVGSRRITLDETRGPTLARELTGLPENHILFLASNGERDAAEAWRRLKAQGVINLYVIEGGVNGWLAAYPPSPDVARRAEAPDDETLGWRFVAAVGERIPSADPEEPARDYARKVVLQRKVLAKGGCG